MAGKTTGLCIVPDCLSAYFRGCRTRFHTFPEEDKVRKKWLKCLNLSPTDYHKGALICSLHFDHSDYEVKDYKSILKHTAVPTGKWNWRYEDYNYDVESIDIEKELENISEVSSLNENDDKFIEKIRFTKYEAVKKTEVKSKKITKTITKPQVVRKETNKNIKVRNEDRILEEENKIVEVCRTCLATECKMFYLKQCNLEQTYMLLTGLTSSTYTKTLIPQMVCFECVRRLQNLKELSARSVKALSFLQRLVNENKLTMTDIKSIDRHHNLLTSKLVATRFDTNHIDFQFEEENTDDFDTVIDNHLKEPIEILIVGNIESNEIDFNKSIREFDDESEKCEPDEQSNDIDCINFDESIKEFDAETDKCEPDEPLNEMDIKNYNESIRELDEGSDKWEQDESQVDLIDNCKVFRDKPLVDRTNNTIIDIDRMKKKMITDNSAVDNAHIDREKKKIYKELFTIKTMTPEEQRAEMEDRKLCRKYMNSQFKCDKCYRGFQLEKVFNDHLKKHTNECGEFICDLCQTHYNKRSLLVKHTSKNHTKYISCSKCNFGTVFEGTATLHKNRHEGVRFQCKLCPKHYSKMSTYYSHLRRCHPEDVVCHLCGLSHELTRQLDRHLRTTHRGDDLYLQPGTKLSRFGPLKKNVSLAHTSVSYASTLPETAPHCTTCDIRFRDQLALSAHLSQSPNHGNPSIYKPPKKSLRAPYNIARAKYYKGNGTGKGTEKGTEKGTRKVTKAPSPYTCELCGVVFAAYQTYYSHFRADHPGERSQYAIGKPQFICEVCGKVYRNMSFLNDHRDSHSGQRNHICSECGKSFTTKMTLRTHKLNHTRSRECTVCGKEFSNVTNVAKHMKIHTHKPYACEPCNKRFCTPSDRRMHIEHFHMGIPWPKKKPKGEGRKRGKPKAQAEKLITEEQNI